MPTETPAPLAPKSLAPSLRRAWICIAIFDVLFLLDSGMRWHQGFGFMSFAWLANAGAMLLVVLAFTRLLALERLPLLLVTPCYVALLSALFCAAGTGSPFNWLGAPFLSFLDGTFDWATILVDQDGLRTAALGTVVHVVWLATARYVARKRPAHSRVLMDLGFGAGFMLAATLRFAPLVSMFDAWRVRHDDQPSIIAMVGTLRTAAWALVFVLGFVLCVRGLRRRLLRSDGPGE